VNVAEIWTVLSRLAVMMYFSSVVGEPECLISYRVSSVPSSPSQKEREGRKRGHTNESDLHPRPFGLNPPTDTDFQEPSLVLGL